MWSEDAGSDTVKSQPTIAARSPVPHLIRLDHTWNRDRLTALFALARRYEDGVGPTHNGGAVLFFPSTSLRTRMSFEFGAARMGLTTSLFPPETLDTSEALEDVARYAAQWADLLIVRHPDIGIIEQLASADAVPVVNAMTSENHPCEVLSDLYALSRAADPFELRYVFVGADGNIARAWSEAATAFGLDLLQCCPDGLEVPGAAHTADLMGAMSRADVVITDAPGRHADALAPYRITADVLAHAPAGARLVPCPPFVRGREVSADAIASDAFAGYGFKRALLPVQQAVMASALGLA